MFVEGRVIYIYIFKVYDLYCYCRRKLGICITIRAWHKVGKGASGCVVYLWWVYWRCYIYLWRVYWSRDIYVGGCIRSVVGVLEGVS